MRTHFPIKLLLPVLVLAVGLFSCEPPAPEENIVELAAGNEDVSTLVSAIEAAELKGALEGEGPFTVFAPSNAAFENLPDGVLEALLKPENKEVLSSILRYHVASAKLKAEDVVSTIEANEGSYTVETLSGGTFSAMMEGESVVLKDAQDNTATVTETDLMGSNGVIHVIDAVLLPEGVDPAALLAAPDIVAVASANDQFSTLVSAVQAAELVETLQGEGPFTVFAPTNEAFDALPEGALAGLLEPENKDQLAGILTYHVVAGEVDAATLTEAIGNAEGGTYTISTVSGGELTAAVQDGNVVLTDAQGNTATVVATDVEAGNGVIHVIDAVVMP
ncbi:MAG: fasciclin domain-containing protein [Bacteroidetes bacterium]|jgi:uncharacterized surface protein with fasciclin (FAS1) repeats|nr:fasciclin domain-containing protein [Bacteroidota bacterium]